MEKEKLTRSEVLALPADVLLTEREAAILANLKPPSLRRYRSRGDGPAYVRPGRAKIGYLKADVIEWLKARRFRDRGHELDEAAKAQRAA
jgi:hypothetical protein